MLFNFLSEIFKKYVSQINKEYKLIIDKNIFIIFKTDDTLQTVCSY